jgi:hypothetical protein
VTTASTCGACGCSIAAPVHAIVAAIAVDDIDRALDLGLLHAGPCTGCSDACRRLLIQTRDARRGALAARERLRDRAARLERRALRRRSVAAPLPDSDVSTPATEASPLPEAASSALARALARARGRAP